MDRDFLRERKQELIELATTSGVDYGTKLQGLPETDDVVAVVALATLLRLDLRGALDPEQPVRDLAAARDARPHPFAHLENPQL